MGMCVRVRRGLVAIGLLFSVAFFGLAGVVVVAAQPESGVTATAIVVQGNRRVEAETVRSYFRVVPGERLDAAKIDAALKALYASGLFEDVRISQSGGRLIVTVVEAPVIDRLAFEGNSRIKDEQLQQEIQSKARGTLSRATVQADVQRIIEVYHRNGRFDVTVVPKIIQRPNNRVDLVFEVKEGEKTGIRSIIFVGNHAYSDYRLRDVIKTSESNWLSFLQTTDVYDADRIEADRDLIRRYYLSHGYADVQVVSATGEYDPSRKGFIITFTIEEGSLYHFGVVDVQSNIRAVDPQTLRSVLRTRAGEIYNGDAVEKTVEEVTVEIARHGYPFATVRPRGDRNPQQRTIGVVYVVDEGVRAYIERINIRGNTRTLDYVIRREFDISEGDAYNRALIDRAERRIRNLNFFKTVKITNEPGSAPDRVVINVLVEEQSTGEFSVMGGFSTANGWMAQASVAEHNLFGTGRYAKTSVTYGQFIRAAELSFVEPYLLDQRMSGGIDLFARQTLANTFLSYGTETFGGTLKLGVPLREDLSLQLRYSIYQQQISLPSYLANCNNNPSNGLLAFNPSPAFFAPATVSPTNGQTLGCYFDGEASLPVRKELQAGKTLTSAIGYSLNYNTLDNNKNPTDGLLVDFKQDFAGVGGDVTYLKSAVDAKYYTPLVADIVGLIHVQGGILNSVGSDIRMLDHFQMGPNLVRGFAPNGIGPRDLNPFGTNDALGGTKYWGASAELQMPFWFLPKEVGLKGSVYADAGSLYDYKGPTSWAATNEVNVAGCVPSTRNPITAGTCTGLVFDNGNVVRTSVGVGLIWASPFGPLRFDYAVPLTKGPNDRVQQFKFGGGTSF